MSITFQVYPRNNKIPSVKEVSDIASMELAKYFQKLGINKPFSISIGINTGEICQLIDDNSFLFNVRKACYYIYVEEYNFSCYVGYRKHEEGDYWNIDGREPFMGMIAGAIGKITDGLIESYDGAWDAKSMPMEGSKFFDSYGNVESIKDSDDRSWWESMETWLIYRYGSNYIYPKYQNYKVERTPIQSRLKYINVNEEILVVMESDIHQQLYFICPQKQIKCDMDILYKIFERLDWLAWTIYHGDFYYDLNPIFQREEGDNSEQGFLSQTEIISNLSKMNISDVWINENFMFINDKFEYKDMLEKIRMIIHNEGDVSQYMMDLNLI